MLCTAYHVLLFNTGNSAPQAMPGEAGSAAAAEVAATAAQLRQWVDTAADKDCLLLHAKVEAAAGR
jgi:hypothetical protein